MEWLRIRRVSTFTRIPYAGNPVWIIVGQKNKIEQKKLLKLTQELNPISDTTFIFPGDQNADIYLRFFSKSEEINFSGHGTIAAYFGIADENLIKLTEPITLIRQHTKSGIKHLELRVKNNKVERVTVLIPVPQFLSIPIDIKSISRILGISPIDIRETNYPVAAVSSGYTDLIVPVKSLEQLMDIKPNFQLMTSYCNRLRINGIVVFTMKTFDENNTVHMRYFAPTVGIKEDPVSGASSASLGCYLLKNRIIPQQEMTRILVEQGHSMNMPGIVYVHINIIKDQILKVSFGGQGVVTFEGRILLPSGSICTR